MMINAADLAIRRFILCAVAFRCNVHKRAFRRLSFLVADTRNVRNGWNDKIYPF